MVNVALKAAKKLQEEGIRAEVIDVKSIEPLDMAPILQSIKKTGHAVIVHEAVKKIRLRRRNRGADPGVCI
jgi:pyruvate dehydrogenase E1 component beta subunit